MNEPDYSAWGSYQTWTLIEAACLLANIDPIAAAQFDKNRATGGLPARIYSDLKDAIDLKQIAWTESRDRYIHGRRVTPSDCITWAAARQYNVPETLAHLKRRDPNETPAQRRARLTRRVEEAKKAGNRAFLKTVASEEGITPARLKQILAAGQALPAPTSKPIPRSRNRY